MNRLLFLVGLLLALLGAQQSFAAQSAVGEQALAEEKIAALKETLGTRAESCSSQERYTIGYGDIITVSLYEEGDMAVSSVAAVDRQNKQDSPHSLQSGIKVMMDGRISLREIGDVEVVGLTLAELADYLQKLYSKIYTDPIVTTTLVQSNSLRYTVMGNVAAPGVFHLDYPMDLVQVVAKAGGFNEWASKSITVVRKELKEEDKEMFEDNTLEFDYDKFIKGKSLEKNIIVRSGDYVIVH